jgi:hypothetical protein
MWQVSREQERTDKNALSYLVSEVFHILLTYACAAEKNRAKTVQTVCFRLVAERFSAMTSTNTRFLVIS